MLFECVFTPAGSPSFLPLVRSLCEKTQDSLEVHRCPRLSPLAVSSRSLDSYKVDAALPVTHAAQCHVHPVMQLNQPEMFHNVLIMMCAVAEYRKGRLRDRIQQEAALSHEGRDRARQSRDEVRHHLVRDDSTTELRPRLIVSV